MTVLVENDLEFDFSSAMEAIIFDDDTLHNPSTIKRVDFIAELTTVSYFSKSKILICPGQPIQKRSQQSCLPETSYLI